MKKNVVIVESPTKSKTIEKYLGKDFAVVASFGHVRDLPSKPNSVEPACNFKMHYEVSPKAEKYIKEIAKVIKDAENVYLATDPDREGESISWHIVDELKLHNKISPNTNIYRITFNEITKKAVQYAIENPKRINMDLVYAQQARRALDYLVGFEISPILWRKLPGSRSAGRVQSVALRLICERENEIEKFTKEEYWSIDGGFIIEKKDSLSATLTVLHGKKLEKMSITAQKDADEAIDFLKVLQYNVGAVVRKETKRNPPIPFITSTLQQEASNNLGISPKITMSIAQKLYEGINIDGNNVGLITYMRTDGIYIAQDVITDMRLFIKNCYGEQYLPNSPRIYKNKVKNAQEAHEAIRPTDVTRTPGSLKNYLDPMQLKLYTIIWSRTLASQMKEAIFDQTTINICSENGLAEFRATGSVLIFDGFLKVYKGEDRDVILPDVAQGDGCGLEKLIPKQHFTQPPPRYTEASIIKTLEDFGIGRPSTYASIISILQDRKYVVIEKKKITPEIRGRIVNAFLVLFFKKYVEYDFTANLEKLLDEVSNGKMSWLNLLEDFWKDFAPTVNEIGQQKKQFIIAEIEKAMEGVIFTKDNQDKDNLTADRTSESVCPKCGKGTMQLKFSKFGGFLGCSNYPECNFVQNIAAEGAKQESGGEYPKILGEYQGGVVSLRKGPYGLYIQHDIPDQKKPKRFSVSSTDTIDLKNATMLLSLPLLIGSIDGKEIYLDKKKFGFFIRYDEKNYSVKGIDPFSLSIADVQKIINKQKD